MSSSLKIPNTRHLHSLVSKYELQPRHAWLPQREFLSLEGGAYGGPDLYDTRHGIAFVNLR